ncbi:nucleoside hydrolase [Brachybacterium phenoliresistens]|uniref:Twin-arginine translocation pathway signal protein n=1 Tax=Brachybacterium phenoliresistens TaxID=396014 RepID=Z9JW87_9MICO|nr:nucleoside hydrolase [Brachybacterium phenoliresistens]EWS82640.1 twin-arginine translocation pathway signal protein [Brachybacterium phenoliresistens]
MTWRIGPRTRVVVDNDWAGDPDGLVALAHHLLSPTDAVVTVTGSFTSPLFGDPTGTAARGAAMARELMDLVGGHGGVPVHAGADSAFAGRPRQSEAARAIVAAAQEECVLVCGGPLTNVADALIREPGITARIRLLWVGGTQEDGAAEYNRDTDPVAARFVLEHPQLRIDRFPRETYRLLAVSVAELELMLTEGGPIGRWLWQRYRDLPLPEGVEVDPVWPLGDSAPLALTALHHGAVRFSEDDGLSHHRTCTALDPRLIIGDLAARLRLSSP